MPWPLANVPCAKPWKIRRPLPISLPFGGPSLPSLEISEPPPSTPWTPRPSTSTTPQAVPLPARSVPWRHSCPSPIACHLSSAPGLRHRSLVARNSAAPAVRSREASNTPSTPTRPSRDSSPNKHRASAPGRHTSPEGSSTRPKANAPHSRSDAYHLRPHARKAFTLIELLAVIAIIGVLVSILLPTLSSARDSARRTACMANLAQIGLATQSYLDIESKGVLPVVRPFHSGEPGGGSDPSLLDVLSQYLDTPVPRRDSPDQDFILASNSVYRCPGDHGGAEPPLWASSGTSYEYFPGLVMTAAELVFAAGSPRLERSVTRALELRADAGRPAPLLSCGDDWHPLRLGGPARNAVYFPSMRADWLEEFDSSDAEALFGDIGRLLGLP